MFGIFVNMFNLVCWSVQWALTLAVWSFVLVVIITFIGYLSDKFFPLDTQNISYNPQRSTLYNIRHLQRRSETIVHWKDKRMRKKRKKKKSATSDPTPARVVKEELHFSSVSGAEPTPQLEAKDSSSAKDDRSPSFQPIQRKKAKDAESRTLNIREDEKEESVAMVKAAPQTEKEKTPQIDFQIINRRRRRRQLRRAGNHLHPNEAQRDDIAKVTPQPPPPTRIQRGRSQSDPITPVMFQQTLIPKVPPVTIPKMKSDNPFMDPQLSDRESPHISSLSGSQPRSPWEPELDRRSGTSSPLEADSEVINAFCTVLKRDNPFDALTFDLLWELKTAHWDELTPHQKACFETYVQNGTIPLKRYEMKLLVGQTT